LLEIRHRIVHRHLPSLAELKRAATESLEWLWEWYWRQLDHAFESGGEGEGEEEMGIESKAAAKEKLQGVLKSYVKERKSEVKRRRQDSKAAEMALSTYNMHFTASITTQRILLELLVDEKMILPTDKKLGTSMSGAFLIWTPLLLALCTSSTLSIKSLVIHLLEHLSVSRVNSGTYEADDPVKEGLYTWLLHILTSSDWTPARQVSVSAEKLHRDILVQIFSSPSFWGLKLAEALLDEGNVAGTESWRAILLAARDDDGDGGEMQMQAASMHVDVDSQSIKDALPVRRIAVSHEEKIKGPVKVLGMWRPRPIGWLAEGWSDDE
jgi:ribosomal biogenesis protein LAS1